MPNKIQVDISQLPGYSLLTVGNTYTVKAKARGISSYTSSNLSTGTSYLKRQRYTITGVVTDGTLSGTLIAYAGSSVTVQITPDSGFYYPESVTITNADNASDKYDNITGVVTISNPTGNVTVTGVCMSKLSTPSLSLSNSIVTFTNIDTNATSLKLYDNGTDLITTIEQLKTPSVSTTGSIASLSNFSGNGNFTDNYRLYVDNNLVATIPTPGNNWAEISLITATISTGGNTPVTNIYDADCMFLVQIQNVWYEIRTSQIICYFSNAGGTSWECYQKYQDSSGVNYISFHHIPSGVFADIRVGGNIVSYNFSFISPYHMNSNIKVHTGMTYDLFTPRAFSFPYISQTPATYDLSQLSLSSGTYQISTSATADGYLDSEMSPSVSYTVSATSAILNIDCSTGIDGEGQCDIVYGSTTIFSWDSNSTYGGTIDLEIAEGTTLTISGWIRYGYASTYQNGVSIPDTSTNSKFPLFELTPAAGDIIDVTFRWED